VLLRWLVYFRLGLVGQILTFTAMVMPIVLRQAEQVFVLVFASAISTLFANAAVLAYPFLYPVIRGPRMARTATTWSLGALVAVSAFVLALLPLEPLLALPRGTFLAASALTMGCGVYAVVLTRMVRSEDRTGMGLARVLYGLTVLVAALVTSLVALGPLALTLGTSLAYVVTAVVLAGRRSHRWPPRPRASAATRRRLRRAYLTRALRPSFASLANGWTAFLPGLALPGLGVAAQPWAIVCRICGGFATVLIQIVAPVLDARLSRAIRDREPELFLTARRSALLVGLVVAVVAVVTGLGLAVYATDSRAVSDWFLPLTVATVLLWGSLLAVSNLNRLPNFLGRHTARLCWDTGRAVGVTVAYVATDGVPRLIAMGAVLSVSGLLLIPMSRWRTKLRPVQTMLDGDQSWQRSA
jgi:hypothetical protein